MKTTKRDIRERASRGKAFENYLNSCPELLKIVNNPFITDSFEVELSEAQAEELGVVTDIETWAKK